MSLITTGSLHDREFRKFRQSPVEGPTVPAVAVVIENESVPVELNPVSTPTITNVVVPLANVEVSHNLVANCKRFMIKARGVSKIELGFSSGLTSYITIPSGCSYEERDISLVGSVLYFRLNKASDVVEILEWA